MLVAGKCPPESGALAAAADRGFEAVELYLERHHLESAEETIDTVASSDVRVVSVHTPHVPLAEREYLDRTDRLAAACDAYVVFHSRFVNHVDTADVEELDLRSPYGYENKTGVSARHLRHMVLRPGHDLVLDVAHLFMAEREYRQELESLLVEYGDRIEVVHLCDSTPIQDGLAFGAGEIDMAATARLIDRHFEGIVVLEVMPDHQRAALEAFAATQSNELSRMVAVGD
jgi:sugar phosphate isomerase/epimerase